MVDNYIVFIVFYRIYASAILKSGNTVGKGYLETEGDCLFHVETCLSRALLNAKARKLLTLSGFCAIVLPRFRDDWIMYFQLCILTTLYNLMLF